MEQYYGFDLGDAESAIARLKHGDAGVPEILPVRDAGSFITAYARLESGELLIGGHLMKGFGEATMLYCMLYGLRFEQRPLTAHVLVAMLLALAYHLSTTGLLVMQSELTIQTNTQWYKFCAYLLIISETVMAVLGFRLTITYNGQLSVMGIVMTGAMLLHLGFNLLLQWSGHDVYVDGGVALVTIAYFWLLERMLLDHDMYMRVIAHGLIDEKL